MKIRSVRANEILDSRGNPTIEAFVTLSDGSVGWAAVPSGASTGKYEAVELRDGDKKRFGGTGVLKAVNNVNKKIAKVIIGMNAADQEKLDTTMIQLDGTENKAILGTNAILSVSMATARAQALAEEKPLYQYLSQFNPEHKGKFTMPIPMMNVMNGGKHAGWATDIQEYMIFPISAKSIQNAVRMCSEIYQQLKKVVKTHGYSTNIGDEGGFAPNVKSNSEPFELITEAIKNAGYKPGKDVFFCIDPAATEFSKGDNYLLNKEGKTVTSDKLADFFRKIASKYPVVSMEDIFAEDDWEGFRKFTQSVGKKMQVVGDDLYVTNVKRLARGIKEKTTNSILIKLNQIGTVTETIQAILTARKNNMTAVVSHRSGETEDPFIADFVVAMGTGQIKTGAPARSERTCKYNQLMRIEKELGEKAVYAKWPFKI